MREPYVLFKEIALHVDLRKFEQLIYVHWPVVPVGIFQCVELLRCLEVRVHESGVQFLLAFFVIQACVHLLLAKVADVFVLYLVVFYFIKLVTVFALRLYKFAHFGAEIIASTVQILYYIFFICYVCRLRTLTVDVHQSIFHRVVSSVAGGLDDVMDDVRQLLADRNLNQTKPDRLVFVVEVSDNAFVTLVIVFLKSVKHRLFGSRFE